jgi:hypothetical protein
MWAQLESAPPRLTERRPELPPLADQVIARAMAKTASGRFATCREFAAALSDACAANPVRTAPAAARRSPGPPGPGGEPGRPRSPSQWPGEGWPTATAIAADGDKIAAGRGRAPGAAAGPYGPVPGPVAQPEPELARNFLTPGTPEASRWPSQPPPSSRLNGSEEGTWRPPPGPASPGRGRGGRHTGRTVTIAICIAIFVLGVAGAVAYRLAHRHVVSTPPATVTTTITVPPKAAPTDPRTVVREFYDDINGHKYPAAWRLTAENGGPAGYVKFRDGYVGTAHDTLTIQSVNGNVVTFTLAALQTDGTVKNFAGTYTVTNGIISSSNVKRVS